MKKSAAQPDVASDPVTGGPVTGDLVDLLRGVAEARQVPYELLCGAVEESLTTAYCAHSGHSAAIARLDRETGSIAMFHRHRVVATVADPGAEIALADVPEGFEVDDYVDRPVAPGSFARVMALTAKRTVMQRVLEFERERVFAEFRAKVGSLVEGLVQRDVNGAIYVLLDHRNEAAIPPWERVAGERFAINDRIVCEIKSVRKTRRGPAIVLSRASERFVRLLVDDPAVLAAARAPGRRTMLLTTRHVDVVAARAQIRGERIEQVAFHPDAFDVIRGALMPNAEIIDYVDLDVVLAISTEPHVFERAALVGRLVDRRVIPVQPHDVAELLADLAAERHIVEAPAAKTEIDPDLIAKLEAFARERDVDAGK